MTVMDRGQTFSSNGRIFRLKAQQKQDIESLNIEYRGVIDLLDSKLTLIGKNLCQLILEETNKEGGHKLLIRVDQKFFPSNSKPTLPTVYKEEYHSSLTTIVAYLYNN